jgi:hypothetical protein
VTIVTTTGVAKRYALLHNNELISSGQLCGTDYLATSLDVVADEDENAFIGAVPVDALPALPDAGAWLEAGDLYSYDGAALMVRQSHSRTEHAIDDLIPTLFLAYREDAADVLAWIAGESVVVGTQRTYDGVTYECLQAHVTQADWTPPATPALWSAVVEEPTTDEWTAGVWYDIGNQATYSDVLYECIQAHTAQIGWEPPKVPALWAVV